MTKKYRVKTMRFVNDDKASTRVAYLPQVLFNKDWCSFPDKNSSSGVVEYADKQAALDNAKVRYDHYRAKGSC